jgi:endoribonuclease Dicer
MNCRIATTENLSLLRDFVRKPVEEEWVYKKLPPPFMTELSKALKIKYGDILALKKVFEFSWTASSELGTWCADQVWVLALADEVLPKLEGSIGKHAGADPQASERAQTEIKRVHEASQIVKDYMLKQDSGLSGLSSKVELLLCKLTDQFVKWPNTKCIVFTERRNTAKVLLQLCESRDITNLRPDVLIGVRKGDAMGMNSTFRGQFLALIKFQKGDINCLVDLIVIIGHE